MPRAKLETVTRIAAHLKASLDLILFSGHKAFVTSQMHLLSVRESYRELEDKTARLQEAFDRLKELDRLKSNFLATVSHELRTPLTSIIGYSEMLAEGLAGELTSEQIEFVKTIHAKGEQLLSLIMSLLDLCKLESGTMRIAMQTMRIEPVLAEVVSTLTPTARKKGVKLELGQRRRELAELRGDPERLRQVFLNLVENAIKFTPSPGTVTLRGAMVEDGDREDDEDVGPGAPRADARASVEVRVADTGIGIPARERAKVFDAFYQVDSSSTREYGGTGLGLSIVKRLVEGHGGSIRIESNAPRGTVFVVRLPQAAAVNEAWPDRDARRGSCRPVPGARHRGRHRRRRGGARRSRQRDGRLVWTVDEQVEGTHFRRDLVSLARRRVAQLHGGRERRRGDGGGALVRALARSSSPTTSTTPRSSSSRAASARRPMRWARRSSAATSRAGRRSRSRRRSSGRATRRACVRAPSQATASGWRDGSGSPRPAFARSGAG